MDQKNSFADSSDEKEENTGSTQELRRNQIYPSFIMDVCMLTDNHFTESDACELMAIKMNSDPESVKSRVRLTLTRGKRVGLLKCRKKIYSLAGTSDIDLKCNEPEDACKRRRKKDPLACFKPKRRKRRSCKKKDPCSKKRKRRCVKKRKPRRRKPPCSTMSLTNEDIESIKSANSLT